MRSLILILFVTIQFSPDTLYSSGFQNSIVKIFTTKQGVNYNEPWKNGSIWKTSATGFIIEGNRILTNAHAVSNDRFIQIRFDNNPERINAEVEYISDDYDLAILRFKGIFEFNKYSPLEFGELPELQDHVTVYGYPVGGDGLSITEGIISRIQLYKYIYSQKNFTVLQTDAAINRGNSGGPVIMNGKVIGVAFQGRRSANNIGYIIPSHIVKHFLNDIKDGEYSGIPTLGLSWLPLESKIHKRMLGLQEAESGILVKKIFRNSAVIDELKKNDVILSLNGFIVGIDGSIEFRPGERIDFNYLLEQIDFDNEIELTILRNKEKIIKRFKLERSNKEPVIAKYKSNVPPTYYVTSGFIFEKLSLNYLHKYTKSPFNRSDTPYQLISLIENPPTDVEEIIFIVSVLADEANIGYHDLKNVRVAKINGDVVRSFKFFIDKLNRSDFVILEDAEGQEIVIDTKLSKERDKEIKEIYNIPTLYSKDLEEYIKNY